MRNCVISSSHFDFYDVINYADIIDLVTVFDAILETFSIR